MGLIFADYELIDVIEVLNKKYQISGIAIYVITYAIAAILHIFKQKQDHVMVARFSR